MDVNKETDLLTQATLLAGAALQAEDAGQKERTIARLQEYEMAAQEVDTPVHATLKLLVLQTVRSAIRFLQTGRQSDAKLTCRSGEKVSKELGRLKRVAQRREAV